MEAGSRSLGEQRCGVCTRQRSTPNRIRQGFCTKLRGHASIIRISFRGHAGLFGVKKNQ